MQNLYGISRFCSAEFFILVRLRYINITDSVTFALAEFLYRAVLIILERKNLRVSLAAESVVWDLAYTSFRIKFELISPSNIHKTYFPFFFCFSKKKTWFLYENSVLPNFHIHE